MFLFIIQFMSVLSIGGVLLMFVRKIPALIELPETTSAVNWQIRKRLFGVVWAPARFFKRTILELKHAEKVDFKQESISQAGKVDRDDNYWINIRKG